MVTVVDVIYIDFNKILTQSSMILKSEYYILQPIQPEGMNMFPQ